MEDFISRAGAVPPDLPSFAAAALAAVSIGATGNCVPSSSHKRNF